MSTSKDLLLAILSMDAYNQGYGKGLDHGKTQIGSATKDSDSVILDTPGNVDVAQAAGFYAISYTLTSGETVISYRGTDFASDLWDILDFSPLGELILTDIPIASNNDFDEPSIHLASKFYQSVNGSLNNNNAGDDPDNPLKPIITTGHSLGGALAGFVGAMHGDFRASQLEENSAS